MKKILTFVLCTLSLCTLSAAIKVHTIGDSTMQDYDESTTEVRGWATYLGSFFDANFVTVNNRGKAGASSRTFYDGAAFWPSVKSQMNAGDYLLIQFAHNDENNNGLDVLEYNAYLTANGQAALTDLRGTCPNTTYKNYLRLYVDEARALGVNPVFVGPICRKYFLNATTLKRSGLHDLGDKFSKLEGGVLYENQSLPAGDSTMSYVRAMKDVAAEKNVPFIDLTSATRDLYIQYGEQQCTDLLFASKGDGTPDGTHTKTLGANLIARLAAQLLQDAGILSQYITIPTDITATPASLSIGETYSGVQQSKEVLLTGFGMEPATGTVSIAAGGDLLISTDNVNFAATAQATYEGSTLFQRIYVHATYSSSGDKEDSLVVTSGSKRIVVPVTANVISLAGGTAVSAYWSLEATPVAAPVVEGPISAVYSLSNMKAVDTKNNFSDGTNSNIVMVRFHNSDDGSAKTDWPAGEIDENAVRYIDFAITAPTTMDVRLTGINMDVLAAAIATMGVHINTGFGDDFLNVKTIYEQKNMPNNTIVHVALTPIVTIPAGETLHIRVLPWIEDSNPRSNKYLCMRHVYIEGQAFEPTLDGMESVQHLDVSIQKVIRDGQLFIIRNGIEYTINGQMVNR
ncbi:MAG: hypothetical protein J5761_00475 [Paludibacteraceae bacterium]|nr:hypothetical protein [Paludibacteraceae bacterium]